MRYESAKQYQERLKERSKPDIPRNLPPVARATFEELHLQPLYAQALKWEPALEGIFEQMIRLLPDNLREHVSARVAVGLVLTLGAFGAVCHQTIDQRYYAITLHSDYFDLISRLNKYSAAIHNPDCILRDVRSKHYTTQDILEAYNSTFESYCSDRRISGIEISLDPSSTEALTFTLSIYICFVFTLGHELAHVILGHLKNHYSRVSDDEEEDVAFQKITKNWEIEYQADLIGYIIAYRFAKRYFEQFNLSDAAIHRLLYFQSATLFEIMQGVSGASYTHPSPRLRLLNITTNLYGRHAGDVLLENLGDPEAEPYGKPVEQMSLKPDDKTWCSFWNQLSEVKW